MMRGLMRRVFRVSVFLLALAVMTPWAALAQEDLAAASEAVRIQKKLYIEKMMELTPQEEQAFWPLYDEYQSGLSKIRKELIRLTANFIQTQGLISDAEAIAMLNQRLKIDADELKFKQFYIAKFMQVLPGRKVARLYQAENRFDTAAMAELQRNIPFIR